MTNVSRDLQYACSDQISHHHRAILHAAQSIMRSIHPLTTTIKLWCHVAVSSIAACHTKQVQC
jgi:hypothetical protein